MRRPWVLPALLGALQLAAWPGLLLLTGAHAGLLLLVTAPPMVGTAMVALSWRRTAPVPAFAVLTVLGCVAVVVTDGAELLGVHVAQLIAVYHVAVRCSRNVTGAAVVAAVLVDGATQTVLDGLRPDLALIAVLDGLVFAGLAVIGRRRREWLAERTAAARRFAEADEQRRRAADDERHRLARELHDVTAHHLTSIVVTATAAQRLGDRRPELAPQALAFAVDTGRSTIGALHRLVAVMQTAAPDAEADSGARLAVRLTTLADGFRHLGQRVELDLADTDPPPAVADAAYGIAREALTNTLRYAAGATVRLTLTASSRAVDLTVEDDGAAGAGDAAGIGSGRGVAGMRDRATALGGSATAGPYPGGGWRVAAHLPLTATTSGPRPRSWWHRARAGDWAVSAALAVAASATPLVIIAAFDEQGRRLTAGTTLLVIAALTHGLPLLLRRHRPWTVLGVVLGTGAAWPVLVLVGAVSPDHSLIYPVFLLAEVVAVHAVAVHGRPIEWTWLAPIATSGAVALTFGVAVAVSLTVTPTVAAEAGVVEVTVDPADPAASPPTWEPLATGMLAAIIAGSPLIGGLLLVWLVGLLPRYRRENTLDQERRQVTAAAGWARAAAAHERRRIAVGLREAVLHRTAEVEAAAVRGDLDAVVGEARAALAAMRGLLNGLRPADGTQRDPQPGTAAIPALARARTDAGRDVRVSVTGAARPLPADVDVSAYRVVELALDGPEHTPATVRVDYTDAQLRLALTGVPATAHEPVRAFLRARVSAVGGTLRMTAADAVDVRLPAPAPTEEVTPSPSV